VRSGEGYGVTHSFSQQFGLGDHAQADKLVVHWPSGNVDTAFDIAANQFLTLQEGNTAPPTLAPLGDQITATRTAIDFTLQANDPEGNNLTFRAQNLPSGLTLDSATGRISGTTALVPGVFSTTITVSNSWSQAEESFTWVIEGGPLVPGLAFGGERPAIPARFEAENYDTGGPGVSYYDKDSINLGREYRSDGVDIATISGDGNLPFVSWIENGEWLEYSLTVSPGNYDFTAMIASPEPSPGLIRVLLDDRLLGFITLSGTSSWDQWQTATLSNINLTESGPAILRLEFVGGPFSFDWMEVSSALGEEEPPDLQRSFFAEAIPLPNRIQAEHFDLGGAGVAYQDNEPENLTNAFRDEGVDIEPSQDSDSTDSLSYFDDGEWLEYTVDPKPGIYEIILRTAAGVNSPGQLRISLAGNELALVQTPDTGGSHNWESLTILDIPIADSGPQILQLEAVGDGINLNWIEFRRLGPLSGDPADPKLSEEELLTEAFGSQSLQSFSLFLNQPSDEGAEDAILTFPTQLGGWEIATGYATHKLRYRPRASTDLVTWDIPVTLIENGDELPPPPLGFKYRSYRLQASDQERAFFRVDISAE
jgi:hypothetical protein